MKKQKYKIDKQDWMVSIRRNDVTRYMYFDTKRAAMDYISAIIEGTCQLFKLSYEFRDVVVKK